jgi:hypothetical protein
MLDFSDFLRGADYFPLLLADSVKYNFMSNVILFKLTLHLILIYSRTSKKLFSVRQSTLLDPLLVAFKKISFNS